MPSRPLGTDSANVAIEGADPELHFLLEELEIEPETQPQLFEAGYRGRDMFSCMDSTETKVRALLLQIGLDASASLVEKGRPGMGASPPQLRGGIQDEGRSEGPEPSARDHDIPAVGLEGGLGTGARGAGRLGGTFQD